MIVERIDELNTILMNTLEEDLINVERAVLLNERGSIFLSVGNLELARTDFDKILLVDGLNVEALKNRAKYYLLVKQFKSSLADANMCLNQLGTKKQTLCYHEVLKIRARCQYELNLVDHAIEDFNLCLDGVELRESPFSSECFVFRGLCYFEKGQYTKSTTDIVRGIRLNYEDLWNSPLLMQKHLTPLWITDDETSFYQKIILSIEKGLTEEEKKHPKQAGITSSVPLLHCQGLVYLRLGEIEKAENVLVKASELDSNNSYLLSHLGLTYLAIENYRENPSESSSEEEDSEEEEKEVEKKEKPPISRTEKCMIVMEKSLRLDPTNSICFLLKGLLEYSKHERKWRCWDATKNETESKHKSIAIEHFSKAISLNERFTAALFMRSDLDPRHEEKLKDLCTLIQLQPNHICALCSRGSVHSDLRNYSLALRDFDRILRRLPDHYIGRGLRKERLEEAKRLRQNGKYEQALTQICKAIKSVQSRRSYQYNVPKYEFTFVVEDRDSLLESYPDLLFHHFCHLVTSDQEYFVYLDTSNGEENYVGIDDDVRLSSNPFKFYFQLLEMQSNWIAGLKLMTVWLKKKSFPELYSLIRVFLDIRHPSGDEKSEECIKKLKHMCHQFVKSQEKNVNLILQEVKRIIQCQNLAKLQETTMLEQRRKIESKGLLVSSKLQLLEEKKKKSDQQTEELRKLRKELEGKRKKRTRLKIRIDQSASKARKTWEISIFERSLIGKKQKHYKILERLNRITNKRIGVFRVEVGGKQVAMKVMLNMSSTRSSSIRNNFIVKEFLYRLPVHPNICRIHHCFVNFIKNSGRFEGWNNVEKEYFQKRAAFFIMPCYKKSLLDYVAEEKQKGAKLLLSIKKTWLLILHMSRAIATLLRQKTVHRDLRFEHIFIGKNEKFVLGSFGRALDCSNVSDFSFPFLAKGSIKKGGRYEEMPPEIKYSQPGPASVLRYAKYDIFSLGILCYSIFKEGYPFEEDEEQNMTDSHYRDLSLEDCPDTHLRNLIKLMLKPKYKDRIDSKRMMREAAKRQKQYKKLEKTRKSDGK